MTRQEIEAEIAKLQKQLDDTSDGDNTENTPTAPPEKDGDTAGKTADTGDDKMNGDPKEPVQEVNENDEIEEQKNIEPQTNGPVTDDVPKAANQDANSPAIAAAVIPGPKSNFEERPVGVEAVGTELPVTVNYDQKFATIATEYAAVIAAIDKLNVQMAQILTRVDLVQEVTEKVVTPTTHDGILTDSIRALTW